MCGHSAQMCAFLFAGDHGSRAALAAAPRVSAMMTNRRSPTRARPPKAESVAQSLRPRLLQRRPKCKAIVVAASAKSSATAKSGVGRPEQPVAQSTGAQSSRSPRAPPKAESVAQSTAKSKPVAQSRSSVPSWLALSEQRQRSILGTGRDQPIQSTKRPPYPSSKQKSPVERVLDRAQREAVIQAFQQKQSEKREPVSKRSQKQKQCAKRKAEAEREAVSNPKSQSSRARSSLQPAVSNPMSRDPLALFTPGVTTARDMPPLARKWHKRKRGGQL